MASEHVKEFTDNNFESEVLKANSAVLVDFWAPWCGPCRRLAPMIDEMASEFAGSVRVGKLNIDDNPMSASRYGINAIPTVLVFKNGQVVQTLQGLPSRERLVEAINGAKA